MGAYPVQLPPMIRLSSTDEKLSVSAMLAYTLFDFGMPVSPCTVDCLSTEFVWISLPGHDEVRSGKACMECGSRNIL